MRQAEPSPHLSVTPQQNHVVIFESFSKNSYFCPPRPRYPPVPNGSLEIAYWCISQATQSSHNEVESTNEKERHKNRCRKCK